MPKPANETGGNAGNDPDEHDNCLALKRRCYTIIILLLVACGLTVTARLLRVWDVPYRPVRFSLETVARAVIAVAFVVVLMNAHKSRRASLYLIVAMVFSVVNGALNLRSIEQFGMAVTGLDRSSFSALFTDSATTFALYFVGFALIESIFVGARYERQLTTYRDHLDTLVEQRTRELEEAQEQLRRTERLASLGTFAAGIAHELNNPLAAIVFATTALRNTIQKEEGSEAAVRDLNFIEDTAHQAGRITRSVLQFAKERPSEKWLHNIADAARHAKESTRHSARRKSIAVSLQIPPDLPEIVMNPAQIEQVFVNLINNAVEASPPGASVTVRLTPSDNTVQMTVQDHGRGMTPALASRIFDPFHTTRQGEGGTGLGLSIAYGIVREHNGTIQVDTAPGRGTTMTVGLPLTQPSEVGPITPGTRVVENGPDDGVTKSLPVGDGNGARNQR